MPGGARHRENFACDSDVEVVAPLLIPAWCMKRTQDTAGPPLIRWEFERNHHHLLCAVHVSPESSVYEVATLPLWDGGPVGVESFATPGAALSRHAAIAARLRDAGWTVSAYTA
jgi:hypothetical protein